MLFFNTRKKIANAYCDWAKRNGIKECPESMIAFLTMNKIIDDENALNFTSNEIIPCETEIDKQLKPCPFCGGKAELIELYGKWYVACRNDICYIAPDTEQMFDKETAIKIWNTREIIAEIR